MGRSVEALYKSKGTKLTLLFCACDSNALGALIAPTIAVLAMTFPTETYKINLLVSVPSLLIIPTSLIVGKLSYYISRKTLLTVGQILYIIGGVGAALVENLDYILFMRVLLGIGCGIVYPIVPTLIAQFYPWHERTQMMGWANAAGGIVAMSMSMAAGLLATISWHLPFYLDLFFVIVLVLQLVFLPKVPPEREALALNAESQEMEDKQNAIKVDPRVYMCIALMFFAFMFSMVQLLKTAIFISEKGFGTSVHAGIYTSLCTAAAVFFAFTFPWVYRKLKRYAVVFPLSSATLAFFALYQAGGIIDVYIGAILFGGFLGHFIPYLQTTVSALAPPSKRTWLLAILTCALYAGQACVTPFIMAVEAMFGTATVTLFGVLSVCFAALLIVSAIYLMTTANYAKEHPYRYYDIR